MPARLKSALTGATGIGLVAAAFLLLCFKAQIGGGAGKPSARDSVVEVGTDKIDPNNDGKLVHFTGTAETDVVLKDPEFGISVRAIRYVREVEMYQWQEDEGEEDEGEEENGEESRAFVYHKGWSPMYNNSSIFEQPTGHENPPMPVEVFDDSTANVHVGAFRLSTDLANMISGGRPLEIKREDLPAKWAARLLATPDGFYVPAAAKGSDPATTAVPDDPQLGDMRIRFRFTPSGQAVSVVAQQSGDTLVPWTAGKDRVNILAAKTLSAEQMLPQETTEDEPINWAMVVVGGLMMFCGVLLSLQAVTAPRERAARGAVRGWWVLVAALASMALLLIAVSVMHPAANVMILAVGGAMLVAAAVAAVFARSRSDSRAEIESPPPPAGAVVLRVALSLAVLGILLGALAYEEFVPRRQTSVALHRLETLDKKRSAAGESVYVHEVQSLIGFKPSREMHDDSTLVEHYVWSSVVPFRSYNLWVVYQQNLQGQWTHLKHGLNGTPEIARSATSEGELARDPEDLEPPRGAEDDGGRDRVDGESSAAGPNPDPARPNASARDSNVAPDSNAATNSNAPEKNAGRDR